MMTYDTPEALRMAIEARIGNISDETGIAVDRLRRRLIFQRVVARLQGAEPGQWVVKGGMAMETRLGDRARLTKDLDLGVRGDLDGAAELRDRLIELLVTNYAQDGFAFVVADPQRLTEDQGGDVTWRARLEARLAGRQFGPLRLDISPRERELTATEVRELPNLLDFAGVPAIEVEIVDINRHAAEKFHGMLKQFDDRENTRVRDLADLMLMQEEGLLDLRTLASDIQTVWAERGGTPPFPFPGLPHSWPDRYERIAADNDIEPRSFAEACRRAQALWQELLPHSG